MASSLSVAPFIKKFYPKYWGFQSYPKNECVCIRKTTDEWGVLGNYYATPITVDGFTFKSSEHLFQFMKFNDPEIIRLVGQGITANNKKCADPKRLAKSYESRGKRRSDWGSIILDALKFALVKKYEQCEFFRQELERSKGKYIVEDQTTFPKKQPDTWGVKPDGDNFTGPNLLGRLLMELRDKGTLEYKLPEDALDFIKILKEPK